MFDGGNCAEYSHFEKLTDRSEVHVGERPDFQRIPRAVDQMVERADLPEQGAHGGLVTQIDRVSLDPVAESRDGFPHSLTAR